MKYVKVVMKKAMPIAKYYGKYGDMVYLHTETKSLYFCVFPKRERSVKKLVAYDNGNMECVEEIVLPQLIMLNEHQQKKGIYSINECSSRCRCNFIRKIN